jgi:uncharacterized protein
MPIVSLAVIATTVVVSTFISGIFGIAGGMVLLGVLLVYFDVSTAMVLFSVIQFFANGLRAVQWRGFVLWPIFWKYAAGCIVAFALMRLAAVVPNKALVYLLLGVLPFSVEILPSSWRPSIQKRGIAFVGGILTTIVQFLAGAGGTFLDIFFQKSLLDRKTTVATKAVTQTFSHVLRAAYFGSLEGIGGVDPLLCLGGIVMALFGTSLAPFVVERMTDHGFRQSTRAIILAIGAVYLARGGVLLWRS